MDLQDFRLICTALGFTTVVMKGEGLNANTSQRAKAIAKLIEEYCRSQMPEAFTAMVEGPVMDFGAPQPALAGLTAQLNLAACEDMASTIVTVMKKTGECMPQDLLGHGFSSEDIDRHWAIAKALANVELNIQDA